MAVLSQNDGHSDRSVLWTVITTVKVTLTSDGPGRNLPSGAFIRIMNRINDICIVGFDSI